MLSTVARHSTNTRDTPSAGLSLTDFTTPWSQEILELGGWQGVSLQVGTIMPMNPAEHVSLQECIRLGTIASFGRCSGMWMPDFCLQERYSILSEEYLEYKSRKPSDLSWVFEVSRARGQEGAKFVGKVIDGVNNLITANDFDALDQTLAIFPREQASEYVLVALARATYPVKPKLKKWADFVVAVRRILRKNGLNHARLLKGLI